MTRLLVTLGFAAISLAQVPRVTTPPRSPTAAEGQLASRVAAGDLAAIHEAERSGSNRYVAVLIGFIRSASDPSSSRWPAATVAAARSALAALITADQMQLLVCNALTPDAFMPVSDAFRIVGGYFGIRSLQMMLTQDAQERWERAVLKNGAQIPVDLTYSPPRYFAVKELQSLLTNGPTHLRMSAASEPELAEAAKIWLAWIPAHVRELEHLKPTGEGVIYSENGCR